MKTELEARRAELRVEVKAQLTGSSGGRVVGLRKRIEESGDEVRGLPLTAVRLPPLRTRSAYLFRRTAPPGA